MANWLSRATEAFRKPPPPQPEPYNVKCDCGRALSGDRVSAAQRPSCPACGQQVFILPANIYPVSVRPKKVAPAIEPAPRDTGPSASSAKSRWQQVSEAPAATKPDGILVENRTRVITPFRLIVSVITIIGTATVLGLWHRHSVESAKATVIAAHEAGTKALKDGDFATAARELSRARDAVNLLNRTDTEANAIRRQSREAIAGSELCTSGLFDVLSEFAVESRQGKTRFGSLYRGSWLIIDAVVINPEATDQPCQLDMPLLIENMRFRIEIDSPTIRSAARKQGATRVIFAAQMSEIRAPSEKDLDAVLVLNNKTSFLWTSPETYQKLGYVESDAEELEKTRDLLASQLEQTESAK